MHAFARLTLREREEREREREESRERGSRLSIVARAGAKRQLICAGTSALISGARSDGSNTTARGICTAPPAYRVCVADVETAAKNALTRAMTAVVAR